MKKFLLLLTICFCILQVSAQKSNKRELRGVWVSTVGGLDWPVRGASAASQKSALTAILEQHRQTGFNTIYFQCRSQSDALYQSNIEPWSWDLTGVQGKDPGYDPLTYAIEETRKRGMEIHAWINPFRAVTSTGALSDTNRFKPFHVAKAHPEWLLTFGTVQILNPGIPEVREYVKSIISDIVRRYDIDGIHFDDYFYLSATVADDATYAADPRGFPNTTAGKQDWRRDNINMFIRDVYDSIKAIKPWVKFGVSPSGIYRSSTNPAIGSNTSSGANQHYFASYADTKKWLQMGWVDYIAPQVYWFINQVGSDYKILIPWWNDNAFGRHIYIGMASYKVGNSAESTDPNWLTDRSQIPKQVRMNRDALYPNVLGGIFFRTVHISQNRLNHRDSLRLRFYQKPALQPTMLWRDNVAPDAPTALSATRYNNDSVVLTWTKPTLAANEMDRVKRFVIYRSTNPAIDITDPENIVAITSNDTTAFRNTGIAAGTTYYYAVTSIDRFHNESATSNFVADRAPTITCPGNQAIYLDSACTAYIPDLTSLVSVANAGSVTQSPEALTAVNGSGNTVVTLTATNLVGQTATCTVTVTANDTIPPTITATNPLVVSGGIVGFNTDAGVCSFTAGNQLDISATDNCSSDLNYSYTITHNAGTSLPVAANSLAGVSFQKGNSIVHWTVSDASGNTATFNYTVVVSDNEAPVISSAITNEGTVNFNTDAGVCSYTAGTNLDITATDNCGSLAYSYRLTYNGVTSPYINSNTLAGVVFQKGSTQVSWKVKDAPGNTSAYSYTVTVADNEAPVITGVSASETTLFPPNHKMKNVTINYSATDNCGAVTTSIAVTSNEPEYGTGSGDTGPDWQVVNNHQVKLRAERSGNGNDRVYTITITATDASGNTSTAIVTVTVPHDNSAVTINKHVVTNDQEEAITIFISPNPTTNRFYVTVPKGSGKTTIRVINSEGRVIEKRIDVTGGSRIALGGNYLPGTYFVEINEGDQKRTVKLVKQ